MHRAIFALALIGCSTKVDPAPAEPAPAPAAEAPAAAPASAIPERKDDASRKSKNGHLVHTIGGVNVDVRYGRPSVAGRPVWGGLVAYGEVWRTGADEATTFAVDKDVLVQGQRLPAGVYALFTIPAESGPWTVVFNKTAAQWGAFSYDQAQDALRVQATPQPAEPMEAMDFVSAPDGVVLRWEKLALPITVAPAT
jgi:Protein of unknown function (DUF2911)